MNSRVISAMPSSVVAFVGDASEGPVASPQKTTSVAEFTAVFGPMSAAGNLGRALRLFFANGGTECWVVRVAGDMQAGLDSLEPVNLVCTPGVIDKNAVAFCEKQGAFLLLDADVNAGSVSDLAVFLESIPRSDSAAVYGPWLRGDGGELLPPSGAVAGLMATSDVRRGIWKTPAGRTQPPLRGADSVAFAVNEEDRAVLAEAGLNVIGTFPGLGILIWGARTLAVAGPAIGYVAVRRLTIFVERSVSQGLEWVAFEANDNALWGRIRDEVADFLQGLYQAGAFLGTRPKDGYWVKCDRTTMTQQDIDAGRLVVVIGFAPVKAAEFVVISISKLAAQTTAEMKCLA